MSQHQDPPVAVHSARQPSGAPGPAGWQLVVVAVTVFCAVVLQSGITLALAAPLCLVAVAVVTRVVRVWELALLTPIVVSLAMDSLLSRSAYLMIPVAVLIALHGRQRSGVRGAVDRRSLGPLLLGLGVAILSLATAIGSSQADLTLLGQLTLSGAVVLSLLVVRSHSCAWGELRSYVSASVAGLGLVFLWQVVPSTTLTVDNAWAMASDEIGWINWNALGMIFAAACADRAKLLLERRSRVLDASVVLILLLATGFTFSRSSYLALVVALSLVLMSRSRWVLLAVPLVALAVQNLPDVIEQRIRYTGSPGDLDASSTARFELWDAATHIALDHPFTGVGIHSLGPALARYGAPDGFVFAHNTYLTVLASLGLLLPLVVTVVLLVRVPPMRRASARGTWRWPVVMAVAVASAFGEPLFLPATAVVSLTLALLPYPPGHERCPHADTSQDPAGERHRERRQLAAGTG